MGRDINHLGLSYVTFCNASVTFYVSYVLDFISLFTTVTRVTSKIKSLNSNISKKSNSMRKVSSAGEFFGFGCNAVTFSQVLDFIKFSSRNTLQFVTSRRNVYVTSY